MSTASSHHPRSTRRFLALGVATLLLGSTPLLLGTPSSPAGAAPTGPRPGADVTPPSAPTGLSASPGDGSVALKWSASTDDVQVKDYTVQAVLQDGKATARVRTAALSTVLTGLGNGATYSITVVARDTAGNTSEASAAVVATPSTTSGSTSTPTTAPPTTTTTTAPPSTTTTTTPTTTTPTTTPATSTQSPTRTVVGTRWVSPSGSDANPGTQAAPWATLRRAVAGAVPGDVVVVGAGTYGARGTRLDIGVSGTEAAPITFVGDPAGPRPTVLGAIRITGDHVVLQHLLFDGPTGPVLTPSSSNPLGEEVQLAVYGDGVEVSDSEVRNNLWHAGIYLSGAEGARIVGNHIHRNGNFDRPEQANMDHGVYFGSGSGLVANNLIEANLSHGVQLYPSASGVTVEHNTIVRNGKSGVMIAQQAANNLVVNNIIAYNVENSVRSHSLTGAGNVARNNVIWGNGNGNVGSSSTGITFRDNREADPALLTVE